jgi:hypothetical protein
MAYKTLCQQGHHEFSLGLNVQTTNRCVYCGTHKTIAAIRALFNKGSKVSA